MTTISFTIPLPQPVTKKNSQRIYKAERMKAEKGGDIPGQMMLEDYEDEKWEATDG